ncbi:MAG TPA: zeta toxin family protein [Opitutaceae bacterium]|nr:zeta toxin family protein [Opitutaceae bacterium]
MLLVLVGPNGAGKSTFYKRHLAAIPLPFINADVLAQVLMHVGSLAAELAEKKRRELMAKRESFITETVFSDPVGAKVQALRDAQAAGYTVVLIFLCVDSAELTALRVESRVRDGGHNVPAGKIAARYERMRRNVKMALTFVDFAILVDNSSFDTPLRPVAATDKGKVIYRNPPLPWWAEEVLPMKS